MFRRGKEIIIIIIIIIIIVIIIALQPLVWPWPLFLGPMRKVTQSV
jgi:hypothetical protein